MKDLKAIRGSQFIARLIAEGEHTCQDFKFAISDARKIARSLSAFANNCGGRLLIGVKDNGVAAGVRNEEDIYVVEQAAQFYCRPAQELKFTAFRMTDGATVIRAEIEASSSRPVQACDTDGRWKAYFRVDDENILASALMVKAWRCRRADSQLSLSIGSAEEMLLGMLRGQSSLDPEEFFTQARVSRQTGEDIITRLYSLGVIDFAFVNRSFHLIAAE